MSELTKATLDENGRCCGRKPITYKRDAKKFCPRCDREFDPYTGEQVANWAYASSGDGFRSLRPPLSVHSYPQEE